MERIIPFDSNPLKAKNGRYRIVENFLAFWYRYVFPVRAEIERGNGDVYRHFALTDLPDFIGPVFEEITLQYLRRLNAQGKLPFVAKSFGKWWGKDRKGNVQELDVVACSVTGKELLIGECKWRNQVKPASIAGVLKERAAYFEAYQIHPYLFTKHPVVLNEDADIVSVSLDSYFFEDGSDSK